MLLLSLSLFKIHKITVMLSRTKRSRGTLHISLINIAAFRRVSFKYTHASQWPRVFFVQT